MLELRQITVSYSQTEDRLQLSGADDQGKTVVLWLTQRLLHRLVPVLTQWLEQHPGDPQTRQLAALPRGDILHSFVQQKAQQHLPACPPVQIKADSDAYLVTEVNVRATDSDIRMTFRGAAQTAGIGYSPTALRQWLGLLYQGYIAAAWPLAVWPRWITEHDHAEVRTPSERVMWH